MPKPVKRKKRVRRGKVEKRPVKKKATSTVETPDGFFVGLLSRMEERQSMVRPTPPLSLRQLADELEALRTILYETHRGLDALTVSMYTNGVEGMKVFDDDIPF